MAPEQAEGRLKAIGPPTDVYGLGCILYEILAGHPPFRGESQLETLRQVIADDPPPLRRRTEGHPRRAGCDRLKCLEKRPGAALSDRPRTGRRPRPVPGRRADPGPAAGPLGEGRAHGEAASGGGLVILALGRAFCGDAARWQITGSRTV